MKKRQGLFTPWFTLSTRQFKRLERRLVLGEEACPSPSHIRIVVMHWRTASRDEDAITVKIVETNVGDLPHSPFKPQPYRINRLDLPPYVRGGIF